MHREQCDIVGIVQPLLQRRYNHASRKIARHRVIAEQQIACFKPIKDQRTGCYRIAFKINRRCAQFLTAWHRFTQMRGERSIGKAHRIARGLIKIIKRHRAHDRQPGAFDMCL